MRRLRASGGLAVAGGACVLVAVLWPLFAQGRTRCSWGCPGNLRMLAGAILQYADDHDDRLPLRDAWMDEIEGRVAWKGAFRCPQAPPGGFGYAFNGALGGARQNALDDVPLVYDSVNPIRNASDLVTSLPSPGRHYGENRIAHAFGEVRLVRP